MCTSGDIAVTYHQTLVVDLRDGIVTLDSGGWKTATTKARMNQASNQFGLGFSVYAKDHVWYVDMADPARSFQHTKTVKFEDGMTFGVRHV